MILALALASCLGMLFIFKYLVFFSNSVVQVFNMIAIPLSAPTMALVLPVGISFYTFQSLSYVIDVYRGDIESEKNFGVYATFVSFFPQLVAGPIERSENLLPQITREHIFDYNKALCGAKLILVGYYKKLVVADVVAQYVDRVYGDVANYHGFDFVLVIFFFTMQIYCDFSGYSDIAIGTAKLLGIDLMTNFCSPYFSKSVKEFWSRWHISLSTWFKDYLYIPLGGNRRGKLRTYLNLLITFILSGLWHGASWTFVFWGGVHGIIQIIEKVFDRSLKSIRKNRVGKSLSMIIVFIFCNLAWVFFRAETFSDAVYVIANSMDGITHVSGYLTCSLGINILQMIVILGSILVIVFYDYMNVDGNLIEKTNEWNKCGQCVVYGILGLMIIFLSRKGVAAEFVYFQF